MKADRPEAANFRAALVEVRVSGPRPQGIVTWDARPDNSGGRFLCPPSGKGGQMNSADLRAWLQWLLRVLNRSPWSLRRALGELGAALADPVAGEDCQGMLSAWAAVVTTAVLPDDQAGIPADILPARVDSADRQAAALRVARERGKVTVADLRQLYPHFCGEVYRRDLALMVADGRLQAVGTNKGRYYVLRD